MSYTQCFDGNKCDHGKIMVSKTLKLRLTDFDRIPLYKAQCRVAGDKFTIYQSDENGIVKLPIEKLPAEMEFEVEWKMNPDYLNEQIQQRQEIAYSVYHGNDDVFKPAYIDTSKCSNDYLMKNTFSFKSLTDSDIDCGRRLQNLGFFGKDLSEQVSLYQEFFKLGKKTGKLNDIKDQLITFHSGGEHPARMRHFKETYDGYAKALYDSFNYGFFNTTDEETIYKVLTNAGKDDYILDLTTFYNNTYGQKGELSLEDELYDELSGDELMKALRLYYQPEKALETLTEIDTGAKKFTAEAKALYNAFQKKNFWIFSGTDEKGVIDVLKKAYTEKAMAYLKNAYNSEYVSKTGLTLEETLYDELSGGELKEAAQTYYKGILKQTDMLCETRSMSCHGTVAPKSEKPVEIDLKPFLQKYQANMFTLSFKSWLQMESAKLTSSPSTTTNNSGTTPSGSSNSSLNFSLPDIGKILTFEKTFGSFYVKLQLPEGVTAKLPTFFIPGRVTTFEFSAKTSDTGNFSVLMNIAGSPDYNFNANIGIKNLTDPNIYAGLSFESIKKVKYEANKQEVERTIKEKIDEMEKAYNELQTMTGNSIDDYKNRISKLVDIATALSDIYSTMETTKPVNDNTSVQWSLSLEADVKVDKSDSAKPEEKGDTINIMFKWFF
jgi:hypothetical protein